MRVSGFTIIRKGVQFGFPFVESIRSGLPLVDEFVVAVGDCDDGTYEGVVGIGSPKLKVFRTTWDPEMKSRGLILSQQTNLALDRCTGDWCVYLQADEVLHEKELERIRLAMQANLHRRHVLGLSFRYKHFMGSYHILNALGYRRQVRIVRGGVGVRSIGDACGFGYRGSKLRPPLDWRVRSTGAWVYHYGWVKPPPALQWRPGGRESRNTGRGGSGSRSVRVRPGRLHPLRRAPPGRDARPDCRAGLAAPSLPARAAVAERRLVERAIAKGGIPARRLRMISSGRSLPPSAVSGNRLAEPLTAGDRPLGRITDWRSQRPGRRSVGPPIENIARRCSTYFPLRKVPDSRFPLPLAVG